MRSTVTTPAAAVLAAALAFSLSGCVFDGKKAAAKNVPPPPAPAAKPAALQPLRSLSTPQTQVRLPEPQPVDPQALAAAQVPEEPAETPVGPRTIRRPVGPRTIAPPKTEPPQAQPPAAVPATTEEARPPIGEIVPPSETKRLQDSADGHKREIRQLLEQARARGLTKRQEGVVGRIESFVKLSDQAQGKGDMREADALAERGLVLAKDLQGGR